MSDGQVVIDTRIDDSGANKGINSLEKSLAPSLKKIGALVAAAFSVNALIKFGKEAIDLASDVQEVQNVVDTAFGEMAYKMEEFADTAIETYGISKLTAKQTGSTFMSMARGMGLAMDSASDMAIELTALSADMASFYNVSQDVAKTALASVFTGETETLKKYGIVMTEVNLQEFAASKGITKKISAMTQSEKVQLRYAYVMNQTALAQGDFAKTSSSWANQTRILSERWKEFMTIVGNGLVQVLTPALNTLNQFMASLISAMNALNKMLGIKSAVSEATKGIEGMSGAMDDVAESTEDATKSQNNLLGDYDELSVISKEEDKGGTGVDIGGDFELSGADTSAIDKTTESLSLLASIDLTNLTASLGRLGGSLANLGTTVWQGLNWGYNNVLKPLGEWTVQDALPVFLDTLAQAVDLLNIALQAFAPVFQLIWDSYLKPLAEFTGGLIIDFLYIIQSILKAIGDFILAHQQDITELVQTYIAPALSSFIELLNEIKTFIVDVLWAKVITPMLPYVEAVFTNIFNVVANVMGAIFKIFQGVIDVLKGIIQFLTGVFTGDWNKALQGIKNILKGVLEIVWGIIKGVVGTIITLLEGAMNIIWSLISGVAQAIFNIFGPMIDWFGNLFNNIFIAIFTAFSKIPDVARNAWNGIVNVFSGLASWFGSIFSNAWNRVKQVFSTGGTIFKGITDGILSAFKKVVNTLIDGINQVITIPFNGINSALKTIRDVSFLGISPFKSIVKLVDIPKIPHLASGAVIPANKEFLAMLGDQKHGTNIETPLDTMIKAFNTALDSRGGNKEPIIIQLPNGRVLAELVWDEEQKRYKQTGSYKPSYV